MVFKSLAKSFGEEKKMNAQNLPLVSVLRFKGRLVYFLAAALALLNLYFYHQLENYKGIQGKYRAVEVLDGDSLVIDLDQTVRLANFNAPELGFCYGKEAKAELERLVLKRYVKIERTGRDQFGRILGMVYRGDELINEVMARKGWGKYEGGGVGDQANRERAELIMESAQEAKDKSLGVWSLHCYQKENLENPNCVIKGNIGKSREEKTYHLPGCSEYERTVVERDLGEQWFCTEEEAIKAGYRKSEHCF